MTRTSSSSSVRPRSSALTYRTGNLMRARTQPGIARLPTHRSAHSREHTCMSTIHVVHDGAVDRVRLPLLASPQARLPSAMLRRHQHGIN